MIYPWLKKDKKMVEAALDLALGDRPCSRTGCASWSIWSEPTWKLSSNKPMKKRSPWAR